MGRKTELEHFLEDVQGKHSKRMNALLLTMEDEDFMVAYFKALEYSTPKLQRQELTGNLAVNKIIVEHVAIPIEKLGESEKLEE